MRLRAPEGIGNPSVGGVTIEPKKGVYDVDAALGAHLVEAFGFVDVDAPKAKAAPIGASPELRGAVLGVLKHFGVIVPTEASDGVLVQILGDFQRHVDAHVDRLSAAEAKSAEHAERADRAEAAAKEHAERADAAEALLAEAGKPKSEPKSQ